MTLLDAMITVLSFFVMPAVVLVAGMLMIFITLIVGCISADSGTLRGVSFLWIVPALFLGASLIVWGTSSSSPTEWIS